MLHACLQPFPSNMLDALSTAISIKMPNVRSTAISIKHTTCIVYIHLQQTCHMYSIKHVTCIVYSHFYQTSQTCLQPIPSNMPHVLSTADSIKHAPCIVYSHLQLTFHMHCPYSQFHQTCLKHIVSIDIYSKLCCCLYLPSIKSG